MTETSAFKSRHTSKKSRKKPCKKMRSFGLILESWVVRLIHLIARLLFKFIYGEKGESMPAITDPILLESATSLASKIRKQEVCSVFWVQMIDKTQSFCFVAVD